MKLITQSRLFGILLVAASLPMDPGVALAASAASAALEPAAPPGSVEARLQRIAAAVREGQERDAGQTPGLVGDDAISYVVVGPGGIGWSNGGWGNGGFYNGGFRNGGGWLNGGGFRNGGFRNHW